MSSVFPLDFTAMTRAKKSLSFRNDSRILVTASARIFSMLIAYRRKLILSPAVDVLQNAHLPNLLEDVNERQDADSLRSLGRERLVDSCFELIVHDVCMIGWMVSKCSRKVREQHR